MDHVAHIKPSDGSSAATQRTKSYQWSPLCSAFNFKTFVECFELNHVNFWYIWLNFCPLIWWSYYFDCAINLLEFLTHFHAIMFLVFIWLNMKQWGAHTSNLWILLSFPQLLLIWQGCIAPLRCSIVESEFYITILFLYRKASCKEPHPCHVISRFHLRAFDPVVVQIVAMMSVIVSHFLRRLWTGDAEYEHSLLRQISSLVRRLPAIDSPKFQDDFLMVGIGLLRN